jgi:hypothetical protein
MGHENAFVVVRDGTPEILVDNFPNSSEKVNVSLSPETRFSITQSRNAAKSVLEI